MELDTSTLMLIFFILFLVISIWKIYAFLPNKALADDDTTKASQEELVNLLLKIIKQNNGELNNDELYKLMLEDESFDKDHFWRFNVNKLNQLLTHYYLENKECSSIHDIYQKIKD